MLNRFSGYLNKALGWSSAKNHPTAAQRKQKQRRGIVSSKKAKASSVAMLLMLDYVAAKDDFVIEADQESAAVNSLLENRGNTKEWLENKLNTTQCQITYKQRSKQQNFTGASVKFCNVAWLYPQYILELVLQNKTQKMNSKFNCFLSDMIKPCDEKRAEELSASAAFLIILILVYIAYYLISNPRPQTMLFSSCKKNKPVVRKKTSALVKNATLKESLLSPEERKLAEDDVIASDMELSAVI